MSSRPRPHLRTVPVRPSLDDAEGPDFARLLTQTLRADLGRLDADAKHDLAARVVDRLRRDPGMIGERMRCAADPHRRVRAVACRMTAVALVIALALVAGRVEPSQHGQAPAGNAAGATTASTTDAERRADDGGRRERRPNADDGSRRSDQDTSTSQ